MPIIETDLPKTISNTSFEAMKQEFFEFLDPDQAVDEESLYILASAIVAKEDFRHIFVTMSVQKDPFSLSDIYYYKLRWIDEQECCSSEKIFTLDEIRRLIFGDIYHDIQENWWYNLSELYVLSLDYIRFDKQYCLRGTTTGHSTSIVERLVDEARKVVCICSADEARVSEESIF